MITIGFRVKPDEVTFAPYDSDARQNVNVEGLRIPKAPPGAVHDSRTRMVFPHLVHTLTPDRSDP